MTTDPDFDRPGFHDLVTPFIFVKHGDPDPVEWKRAHPGWVSFPATFVPHKRPPPKWTILNGRRWPLDKRGQPWPRSRFGQPMRPLDEFPPGVPAPGTQGRAMEEQAAAIQRGVEAFQRGETSVEWFLAEGARYRAERAAREAANPSPLPPAWEPISDPLAPVRAYQEHRVREVSVMREVAADSDGLGSVREYGAMMRRVDASMREFAEGARQRNASRAEQKLAAMTALVTSSAVNMVVALPTPVAKSILLPNVPQDGIDAQGEQRVDDLLLLIARRRGTIPTPLPGGGARYLTPAEAIRMFRFDQALERLRKLNPNSPELNYLVQPNTVPSEAWIARLEYEVRTAEWRPQVGQPPSTTGQSGRIQPNLQAPPVDVGIYEAVRSPNSDIELEGQVARLLEVSGISITGFQRKIIIGGVLKTEIDIETKGAIIEVTTSSGGKLNQITSRIKVPEFNPMGKKVILYAPNYNTRAGRDIEAMGGYVARTQQELIDLVKQFGS